MTIPASLATAKLEVQLDLGFGEPVEIREISYPTLHDDQDITMGWTSGSVASASAA